MVNTRDGQSADSGVFQLDIDLDDRGSCDRPVVGACVGIQMIHAAFTRRSAAGTENDGLQTEAPNLAEHGILLLSGGNFNRDLIDQTRIAHREVVSRPNRKRQHSQPVNSRDHIMRFGNYFRSDPARRPHRFIGVGFGICDAAVGVIEHCFAVADALFLDVMLLGQLNAWIGGAEG